MMEEILETFLHHKQENASKLSVAIDERQEEMIASFGGLTNMIELCLTNPNASNYIDPNCE